MRRIGSAVALLALAGCSLEPKYVRPVSAVPSAWPTGDAYRIAGEAAPPVLSYRDVFRDPQLQAIIAQALANSQDLRQSVANIEAARAQYRVQRASLIPDIGANGRAVIAKSRNGTVTTGGSTTGTGTSGTGTGTDTGTGTGTGTTGSTGTGTTIVSSNGGGVATTYNANVGLSGFEIDLFGRLRSLNRAAFQEYLATEAGARAARLSLVANVADAYLTLATDRSLLAIARETENSSARSVQLTQARLSGGVAPRTDLRQAQTVLEQARADLAQQVTAVAQDRNALELLAGGPIADGALPASIEAVDPLLAEVPAGLDSRILLRRPDVAQAEHVLEAANARIGAARAAFFPTISLTATIGFASTALSSLFTGGAFAWSATPNVALPIFDGGALRGNLALIRARREIAVAQYQAAIQTAFRDVANALARRGTAEEQLAARQRFTDAAADTASLSEARYREGVDPFLNTLDAQRTLYSARRTLASTRLIRAQNLVDLYRSLGGDMLVEPPALGARDAPAALRRGG